MVPYSWPMSIGFPCYFWNIHAYRAVAKVIKQHDVQHWITTSPPHSTQLIGLRIKKNFGVNWTADFRDPWTDIYYYRKFYPTALTRIYERALERKVFASCDQLISVSPAWSQLYATKGAQPATKTQYNSITVPLVSNATSAQTGGDFQCTIGPVNDRG